MTAAPAVRTVDVRHEQLARALFAAIAAIMITFSRDHSASVGMSVFSGFATASAIAFFLSAWLVHPAGRRRLPIALGSLTLVGAILGGLPPLRTTIGFFAVVISWAAVTGVIELVAGIRRRRSPVARDQILVGALGLALAVGLLIVNPAYSLEYVIAEAGGAFTLTGITIAVGIFGGYAAVIAVFLGIAGFSPRAPRAAEISENAEATASASPHNVNPEVAS